MTEFSGIQERTVTNGDELLLGSTGEDQTVPRKMTINSINAFNGIANVRAFGADNTGATDCAPEVQAAADYAAANGLTLLFPPGIYQINDSVTLDHNYDHTIEGKGDVLIRSDGVRRNGTFWYHGLNNMGGLTTITSITNGVWPAGSPGNRETSTIYGNFAGQGYKYGDLVNIQGSVLNRWGTVDAEWIVVMKATDGYIVANKPLLHNYNPGSNTVRCKRMTKRPKITIKKGLRFTHSNGISSCQERFIQLYCAFKADIHIAVDGPTHAALGTYGDVMGKHFVETDHGEVSYSDDAYGYGAVAYGCCYMTELGGHGFCNGHVCDTSPHGTGQNDYWIGISGVGHNVNIRNVRGLANPRAMTKSHAGHQTLFQDVYGVDLFTYENEDSGNCFLTDAVDLDAQMTGIYGAGVQGFGVFANQKGDNHYKYRNMHIYSGVPEGEDGWFVVPPQDGTVTIDAEEYPYVPD